jgi:hypothetical protein
MGPVHLTQHHLSEDYILQQHCCQNSNLILKLPIKKYSTQTTSVLLRHFTKWKPRANIHKTEAIIITRRRPATPPPVCFQHTVIPWNTRVRYLGVTLDSKLLFTKHINSVTHRTSSSLLRLHPLLARDSTLTLTNKPTLYKLIIPSILSYAAPVWSNTSSYN